MTNLRGTAFDDQVKRQQKAETRRNDQ